MTESSATARTRAREFTITRVFDAPRELVFKTWTEPEQVACWFGPRGFTTPLSTITMDVRPGGVWRACMIRDDETEHPTGGVYREVVEPERLVFTWGIAEGSGVVKDESVVTITFADLGGKTKMTFTQAGFSSDDERTSVEDGWTQSIDRLAGHLTQS
jgi:uncharacterized protein YndB with AHSA1/START domain